MNLWSGRWTRHVTLTLVIATLVVAACGSTGTETIARAGDLGHIHDLVLTEDGDLLVASHTGLYRIADTDSAVLVGDERHDLMAMAADSQTLIASGHPNLLMERYQVEGRPPFLGLVRSSDRGESWQVIDLLGHADFHALVPTSAGLFAAETTGRIWHLDAASGEWTQLGAVDARDLAIDPTDPTRQLAPDYDGAVWASKDRAASWEEIETAPSLIEIEWVDDGRIIGVTEGGIIWTAEHADGPWTESARFDSGDEVETFYVDPDGDWWITVHGGAISQSTDGGATWEQAYVPPNGS